MTTVRRPRSESPDAGGYPPINPDPVTGIYGNDALILLGKLRGQCSDAGWEILRSAADRLRGKRGPEPSYVAKHMGVDPIMPEMPSEAAVKWVNSDPWEKELTESLLAEARKQTAIFERIAAALERAHPARGVQR